MRLIILGLGLMLAAIAIGCASAPLETCKPPAGFENTSLMSAPCKTAGFARCEWSGDSKLYQAFNCAMPDGMECVEGCE